MSDTQTNCYSLFDNNRELFDYKLEEYKSENNIKVIDFNEYYKFVINYFNLDFKFKNEIVSPFYEILENNKNPTILALAITLFHHVDSMVSLEYKLNTELMYIESISNQNEKTVNNINNNNIEDSKEYMDLLIKFNSLKTKHKDMEEDYIEIQNKKIPVDVESDEKFLKLKEDYDNLVYEKEHKQDSNDEKVDIMDKLKNEIEELKLSNNNAILKKENEELQKQIKELKLNNNKKEIPLLTPSSSTENKNNTTKNGGDEFSISTFCRITGYDNVDKDVKNDIMKELLNSIKMYSDIYIKIKDIEDEDEIINWLIKNRHIKYFNEKDKNRYRIINKYKRSNELYIKFNDDLQYIYFSFSKMTRIAVKYWKDWLNILENKIEEEKLKYKTTKNGGDNFLKIKKFDNKKFKRFMLLTYILKNKDLIKKKLNKEIKLEYYKNMDLSILKKGEMFDYLNNNGTKSRKRFNGLCIDCEIKEVEDSNNNRCNACISFLPYGTEYTGLHGQRKTSKGPCEANGCPYEKRNVYKRLCKTCYNFSNGKNNPNNEFNDEYIGEDYDKIHKMVKEYRINNTVKICKNERCNKTIPNKYEYCMKHNQGI